MLPWVRGWECRVCFLYRSVLSIKPLRIYAVSASPPSQHSFIYIGVFNQIMGTLQQACASVHDNGLDQCDRVRVVCVSSAENFSVP